MRHRKDPQYLRRLAVAAVAGLTAAAALAVTAEASPEGVDESATAPSGRIGPYLHLGWGDPPEPTSVMAATGITQFTLAYMLSDGGCEPKWDGERPLTGGTDESVVGAVRGAGGDVTVSFGGWGGNKLGEKCRSAGALADAYQKVIDAYRLTSIDIDIESSEAESAAARRRVVGALKTVKRQNSGLKVYVTFGATTEGPDADGKDLIARAAAAGLEVDGWTVMPFDFGRGGTDMAAATRSAVDGLKDTVAAAYGLSSDAAYRKVGFSSMNGVTDVPGEHVSPAAFKAMVAYARQHRLARVSFWSVNRDRQCGPGSTQDACSGIAQKTYDFTKVLAHYEG